MEGLRDELRKDTMIMKPINIEELCQSAKLVEDNLPKRNNTDFADTLHRLEQSINNLSTNKQQQINIDRSISPFRNNRIHHLEKKTFY